MALELKPDTVITASLLREIYAAAHPGGSVVHVLDAALEDKRTPGRRAYEQFRQLRPVPQNLRTWEESSAERRAEWESIAAAVLEAVK